MLIFSPFEILFLMRGLLKQRIVWIAGDGSRRRAPREAVEASMATPDIFGGSTFFEASSLIGSD
jgi:hypothetical protein